MPGKHGSNRFENYQSVHQKRMQDFLLEGFVLEEDLRFQAIGRRSIVLYGSIRCLGGIVLEVEKELQVLDGAGPTARVQTRTYRYHAWLPARHNILRYDSPHAHRPYHHVHRFDALGTGREVSIDPIEDEAAIPTLSEVLDELRDWFYRNADTLGP